MAPSRWNKTQLERQAKVGVALQGLMNALGNQSEAEGELEVNYNQPLGKGGKGGKGFQGKGKGNWQAQPARWTPPSPSQTVKTEQRREQRHRKTEEARAYREVSPQPPRLPLVIPAHVFVKPPRVCFMIQWLGFFGQKVSILRRHMSSPTMWRWACP